MSSTTPKPPKGPCCKLSAALGPERMAELDAELRRPNHLSFRKLAGEYQVRHNAIDRHKKGCLHLGEPMPKVVKTFEVPPLEDLPPVKRRPAKGGKGRGAVPAGVSAESAGESRVSQGEGGVSHETADGTGRVPDGTASAAGTDRDMPTRARAHESENPAERRRNRVMEIIASMSDGTWDTPRDNAAKRAAMWGVSKATVEDMVREAAVGAVVDPESVKQRRAVALGRWGWGVQKARDEIEAGPEFPDTMSKLLASYAQMQTGWDKAAGVLDESTKVQVNVVAHPVFMGMLESVLLAVAPYPEAKAAVMAAVKAKLDVLRQSVPAALASTSSEPATATIDTTGEAA